MDLIDKLELAVGNEYLNNDENSDQLLETNNHKRQADSNAIVSINDNAIAFNA
ncbi:TPA: hypothetical protein ACT9I4_002001 [Legionella pneumophila]